MIWDEYYSEMVRILIVTSKVWFILYLFDLTCAWLIITSTAAW